MGSAALLSACSSSPPVGVLTNADMPAVLHLKSAGAADAQSLVKSFDNTYPSCSAHYAVFTENGRAPTPSLTGKTIYVQAISESANCPSPDKAQAVFNGIAAKVKGFGGKNLSGIGDGAVMTTARSKTANQYVIFWQHGSILASLQLSGPAGDSHVSLAETERLARLQVAGA